MQVSDMPFRKMPSGKNLDMRALVFCPLAVAAALSSSWNFRSGVDVVLPDCHYKRSGSMRFSLLLPAALLALSGCVAVTPAAREPATTTVVTPAPTTYAVPAPVTTDTTTTTTKRW
jgi:hypothetical protein